MSGSDLCCLYKLCVLPAGMSCICVMTHRTDWVKGREVNGPLLTWWLAVVGGRCSMIRFQSLSELLSGLWAWRGFPLPSGAHMAEGAQVWALPFPGTARLWRTRSCTGQAWWGRGECPGLFLSLPFFSSGWKVEGCSLFTVRAWSNSWREISQADPIVRSSSSL